MGLLGKFNFGGAHPNPGPAGSTPPNGGVCNENRAGASKQKLLLGVGLLCKFLLVGAHSNPGPTGSTPPNGGDSLNIVAGASKQKLLLGWVCIAKLYFGGSPHPGAYRVHPTKWGY